MIPALRPYQLVGRDFLATHIHALLADEMRVGKTPQAILAAVKLGFSRVLVLCPAIATQQWVGEWQRWANLPAVVYAGGPVPDGIVVASYSMVQRHVSHFNSVVWELMIVDECHNAKNPNAGRTRMIYGKSGLGWRAGRIWALSGTPAPNHAGELWPMLRAFGAVGATYGEFTRRFCTIDMLGRVHGTKTKHIPELRKLLEPIMLRRLRKDVAPELPAIDYNFLELSLIDAGSAWVSIPDNATDPLQYQDERALAAMAKAPKLAQQVATDLENGMQQTVVFGHFKGPLALIRDYLSAEGFAAEVVNGETPASLKQEHVHRFQTGEIRVLCANILTAGTAVDLSAADHGYFLELDWVPGNNAQAASRLLAIGKATPVSMDIANWSGGPDAKIIRALARKTRELSELFN